MKNGVRVNQQYGGLFVKMLLDFADGVFRESVGEYVFLGVVVCDVGNL